MLGISLLLTGCNAGEGSVMVDVGSAPLARAYRVDLYAREAGLDVVEGVYVTDTNQVTIDSVPEGEWALLVQAQNGDLTTIGHYQAQIEVMADQTTSITAGAYRPGLPGDPLPENTSSLESFGPDGEALLSAVYAAPGDTTPATDAGLTVTSGEGQADEEEEEETPAARSGASNTHSPQCGTCFISTHDVNLANMEILGQQVRPQVSVVPPGDTIEVFVITTFETAECQRLLNDSQTENCLIYAEVVGGNPVISEAQALEIAQGFDSDNPFQEGDNGIYNDTRDRYGSEWRTDGGRDGEERVFLVFLSSGTIGGEGLFGFFNPADESDPASSASSNGGEILYLNADRANDDLYDSLGTIAHEFSHLILFNQKVARNGEFPEGADSENAVIDEGLAVLNEELSGFGYTGDQGGNFFLLSSVSNLLDEGLNRTFFQFGGQLSDYGAGYFLVRFLHDQNGLEAVTSLTTSTEVGRANFETVLGEPFLGFFQRFGQALALSERTDLPTEIQFTDLDLFATYPSREGTTFELDGLQNIRAVTLPGTLTAEESLQAWGTIFFLADGGDGSALTWTATGAQEIATSVLGLTNAK